MKCSICGQTRDTESVQRLEFLLSDMRKRAPELGLKPPDPGQFAHPSCALNLKHRFDRKEAKRANTR